MHLQSGVPKITALLLASLLTGCAANAAPETEVREMRTLYQSLSAVSGRATITADYGDRIYTYTAELEGCAEAGALTVEEPESIAGAVLRWSGADTSLDCDEVTLETGALTDSGLSPADAVPTVLTACRSGSLISCGQESDGTLLRAELENPADEAVAVTCWFEEESWALRRAELAENGRRIITLDFSRFDIVLEEEGTGEAS